MIRIDSLQITPKILGLIAGIDEFRSAWHRSNRNTLKQHFRALVEQANLAQQERDVVRVALICLPKRTKSIGCQYHE